MPSTDGRIFSQIRLKRLCAFIIDLCVLALLAYATYAYFKFPDYYSVKQLMDEVNRSAAGSAEATALANRALALFNVAYFRTLLIWLAYEILCQFIFKGATLGKLAVHIRVVPINPARGIALHYLLITVRSIVKVLFAYIFQGIPLLLAALTIFTNKQSQSGYDMIVKSRVAVIDAEHGKELKNGAATKGEGLQHQ
jgi:uncharacterized RDD family membrane protein YckC